MNHLYHLLVFLRNNLQSTRNDSESDDESPSPKKARNSSSQMNKTFDIIRPVSTPTSVPTATRVVADEQQQAQELVDYYKPLLEEFIQSDYEHYQFTRDLTKEQRAILHKLAEELGLKHETKGNWRKKTQFLFKNQLILPSQRNSQAISTALQNIASASQQENQNVLDVVAADVIAPTQGAKKRGRPAKNSQPQPSNSQPASSNANTEDVLAPSTAPRYNLRRRGTNN